MQYNKEKIICILVQNASLSAGTERAATKLSDLLKVSGFSVVIRSVEGDRPASVRPVRWFRNFNGIRNVVSSFKRDDVIFIGTGHFINISLAVIGLLLKINIIACEHLPYKIKTPLQKLSARIFYPLFNALVVLTKRDASDYTFIKKVKVIPNYIEESEFASNVHSDSNSEAAEKNQYLIVGRLCYQKGSDLIPQIAAKLAESDPECSLNVIGDGPMLSAVMEEVKGSDLKVNFLGGLPKLKVLEYMQSAHVLLLPSRYEGFPFVMLESLASGTPVVAFDCHTGPSEIISSVNVGSVVPMYDIDLMVKESVKLVVDIKENSLLREQCVGEARKYTMSPIAENWLSVIKEI